MDKTVLQMAWELGFIIYAIAAALSVAMLWTAGDAWYGIIWLIGVYPFVKIMCRLNNLIKFNGK